MSSRAQQYPNRANVTQKGQRCCGYKIALPSMKAAECKKVDGCHGKQRKDSDIVGR